MNISPIFYLIITTLVLITVTIFAAMDLPFSWVFYLSVFGQALLVFSVIKVLKDNYTTDKTFKDFYEDHPIGREEKFR
jgi:TRAP-type C4-dicarboxylate transport system permease small subunit